jgi:LPS-assembly protein
MLSRVRIALLAGLPWLIGAVQAQQPTPGQQAPIGETAIAKQVSPNKAAPLLLQADDLIYDNRNNRVIARGNVEIYQDDNVLLADEVIYDKRANALTAIGNVRLRETDGSVVNADRMTLSSNFRDGFVRSLKALTQDDTRVAAANAYKKGNQTVYEKGVLTSCKPCEEHPDQLPIWRIKATRIIQDKDDQNIYYEDATFEFYGIPIAWVPYFYTPDNTVKQRSGFLTPEYSYHSSTTGYSVAVPYYYAVSPSADLTLTPVYTSQAGYLMEADWRQRLWNGSYEVKLYGAFNDNADDFLGDRNWRGSAESKGDFALNSAWHFGWNAILESDYTFRRFYNIDDIYAAERVSTIYLTGQWDRNYFSVSVNRYGNLLGDSYVYETNSYLKSVNAWSYPVIDYNYIHNKPVFGGEFSFNINAVALQVNDPPTSTSNVYQSNSDHIAADVQWRRTFKDDLGQVFTPILSARGDVYDVSAFRNIGEDSGSADTFTRQMVSAALDYRYPFVANTNGTTHVIEPVVQIVSRAGASENNKIPIEDAQSLVFDDTLLFDLNKFSGYDQVETGTRTNFGVQYTMQASNGISVRTVGGESVQLAGKNSYNIPIYYGTGLETTRSDYVLGTYIDYKNLFRVVAQLRFNESDFSVDYQSYSVQAKLGFLQAGVSYESVAGGTYGVITPVGLIAPTVNALPSQEVSAFAALKLNDEWSVFGDARYDFETGQFIRNSAGIQYADECFIYSVTYQQTWITLGDIRPDTSVLVRIGIKGFGQQTAPTSIYDLSPEAQAYR